MSRRLALVSASLPAGMAVRVAFAVAAGCAVAATPASAAQLDTTDPTAQAQAHKLAAEPPLLPSPGHRVAADDSGRKQVGVASVYARHFQGRHMANGSRFDHRGNAAASKTLPLGTIAKVTDTETGRTAVVQVQDHGPFVNGRTLDVSRSTARQLGLSPYQGIAPVVVAPVAVPQPDGAIKVGAGALPGPATVK